MPEAFIRSEKLIKTDSTFKTIYGLEEHLHTLSESQDSQAGILYSLWKLHKERLSKLLVASSSIFDSYTDHGPLHSQAIVHAINRLLGDRVYSLQATDTWMLLECAYLHDVGMHIPHRDIVAFVNSPDYDLLLDELKKSSKELRDAADRICSLNISAIDSSGESAECLLKYKKDLDIVLQKHFRECHGNRTAHYITSNWGESKEQDIPVRIWHTVANVCAAHQWNRDDILIKLEKCEQGCGSDTAHPRFVAELLRLGDLFDMDNNRYNPYQLELWGNRLPALSEAHRMKHSALHHLYISPKQIEAVIKLYPLAGTLLEDKKKHGFIYTDEKAHYKEELKKLAERFSQEKATDDLDVSIEDRIKELIKNLDEIQWNSNHHITKSRMQRIMEKEMAELLHKACTVSAEWYGYIENELKYFAEHWQEIVPDGFTGGVPRFTKAEIWWNEKELDRETIRLKYSISHLRATSIILGTGLYGDLSVDIGRKLMVNHRFVFLRELLQNAMDATKLQVFLYILQCHYGEAFKFGNRMTDWNPIEVMGAIGNEIKHLKVELLIYYNSDSSGESCKEISDRLVFVVKDAGTGIDIDTLKYMSEIGNPKSSALTDIMPEWLRPNGAFGIGMQSVFGLVNSFRAKSGARKDHVRRDLYFHSAKENGALFAIERQTDKEKAIKYGTKICIELNDNEVRKAGLPEKDCAEIFKIMLCHLDDMIGQDLFPVNVRLFVDSVEVLYKQSDKIYSHVKEYPSILNTLIQPPKANWQLCEDDNKKFFGQVFVSEDNKLHITGYDLINNIYFDMALMDISDDMVIDERLCGDSAFQSIDFYYRGMRVPHVWQANQMPYPCWEIKAYAYFGKAQDYLMISRNQLMPLKIQEVYKKIAKSADQMLTAFWEQMFKEDVAENVFTLLKQEQYNALALSLLFQSTVSSMEEGGQRFQIETRPHLQRLLEKSSGWIVVLCYEPGKIYVDRMTFLHAFKNGLSGCWMTNTRNFVMEDNVFLAGNIIDIDSFIIVQDIFTDYLLKRELKPKANEILLLKGRSVLEAPYLTYIYKLKDGVVGDSDYIDWAVSETIREEWIRITIDILKKQEYQQDGNRLVVLPAFAKYKYSSLALTDLEPLKDDYFGRNAPICPEMLRSIGSYYVLPFTYNWLCDWIKWGKEELKKEATDKKAYEKDGFFEHIKKAQENEIGDLIDRIKEAAEPKSGWYKKNTVEGQVLQFIHEKMLEKMNIKQEMCRKKTELTIKNTGEEYVKVVKYILDDIIKIAREDD